jgi:superfamily II DNA or RNA helicase
LYSWFGLDLLDCEFVRRALLEPLEEEEIPLKLRKKVPPELASKADRVAVMARQPWVPGSTLVDFFSERYRIPPEYIPSREVERSSVEFLSPPVKLPRLFDYQEDVANQILKFLHEGDSDRVMVQLPTGAGKTMTCGVSLARYGAEHWERHQAFPVILWIAHTDELLRQADETLSKVWKALGVAEIPLIRYYGGKAPSLVGLHYGIVLTSYQRLMMGKSPAARSLRSWVTGKHVVCVLDEAHKALAREYRKGILSLMDKTSRGKMVGLTATPGRGSDAAADNLSLVQMFRGRLLTASELGEDAISYLQAEGILASLERRIIENTIGGGLNRHDVGNEDFVHACLKRLAADAERNEAIVDIVQQEATEGRSVLVFACSVDHAEHLAANCSIRGVLSAAISSRVTRSQRIRIINDFKTRRVMAIFNFEVLSTGFDVPGIDSVLLARPTASVILYSQMIGRALRGLRTGGGATARIIEFSDSVDGMEKVDSVYHLFDQYWA